MAKLENVFPGLCNDLHLTLPSDENFFKLEDIFHLKNQKQEKQTKKEKQTKNPTEPKITKTHNKSMGL